MNAPPRKVLRPKQSFQASELAGKHADWTNTEHARVSIEAAIAELTMLLPRPNTLEEACRLHYELLGARRFIDIFLNLAQPDTVGIQRPDDNLVWQNPRAPKSTRNSTTSPGSHPPKA